MTMHETTRPGSMRMQTPWAKARPGACTAHASNLVSGRRSARYEQAQPAGVEAGLTLAAGLVQLEQKFARYGPHVPLDTEVKKSGNLRQRRSEALAPALDGLAERRLQAPRDGATVE